MRESGLDLTTRKEKFMASLGRMMPVSASEWSYSRLQYWLEKNTGESADDAESHWIEPRNDSRANSIQKISYRHGKVREPLIVKAVEGLLSSKDNVAVAYGAGHFIKQAPVYAKAFGPPKIECLSGEPRRSQDGPAPEATR